MFCGLVKVANFVTVYFPIRYIFLRNAKVNLLEIHNLAKRLLAAVFSSIESIDLLLILYNLSPNHYKLYSL